MHCIELPQACVIDPAKKCIVLYAMHCNKCIVLTKCNYFKQRDRDNKRTEFYRCTYSSTLYRLVVKLVALISHLGLENEISKGPHLFIRY